MFTGQPPRGCQAQAAPTPGRTAGEEGIEHVLALFQGESITVVLDDQLQPIRRWSFEADARPTVCRGRFNRIPQQSRQRGRHLVAVGYETNGVFRMGTSQPDSAFGRQIVESRRHLAHQLGYLYYLFLRLRRSGELHQVVQDLMNSLSLSDHRLKSSLPRRIGFMVQQVLRLA